VSLTLQDLVGVDPGAIRASADAWDAMAEDLDDAAEELIRGSRDLHHVWPDGPAAQAAAQRTRDTRNEASNAVPPCRRISRALREYADTLRSLQGHANAITAEARGNGYVVDVAAGTVAAGARQAQDSGAGQYLGQAVTSYARQLGDVLERAVHCDQVTAGIIKANLPDPGTGFGSSSAVPVGRADVEAQQGRSPADVNAWWDGLTPEQHEQAIRDAPQLLGRLDGVPATDRDTANRLGLAHHRADLDAREADIFDRFAAATPPQKAQLMSELDDIRGERSKLDEVDKALTKLGPRGYLLGLDTTADGRAIVAVGNPDTATHTGVWVPGLGTTLEGRGMASGTVDNVDRMIALHDAADGLTPGVGDVSTVYWLGYDAPDLDNLSVVGEERSRAGSEPYVSFMQGMRASHEGDPGHLVAMGHSYGTTVLGEAALTSRLPVDDIVTAGSPGMHTDHSRNLHIDPRHVWAGSAPDDPVSQTSNVSRWTTGGGAVLGGPVGAGLGWAAGQYYEDGHHVSPHDPAFGANQYRVDTSGHSDYWQEGSESLKNQARILVGDYQRTGLSHGEAPSERP
jgi:hypothetical protein